MVIKYFTMKTKTLIGILLATLLYFSPAVAQDGVKFQYTDADECIEATPSDQLIFVDLFASWCGPCQMMDKQVFPLKHVGEYVNANFVTCRLDADDDKGKAFMAKHHIDKLPTLVVIKGDGTLVQTTSGMMDDYGFLRFLRKSKGDLIDMETLYRNHRKDKKNTEHMKAILLEAPYFIQTVTSETQMKKWGLRISDIFKLYADTKGVENMTNMTDFRILSLFHNFYEKDDAIINAIIRNFQDFAKGVDEGTVAQFITGAHMNYIIGLAQKCDKDYEREIGRITSDMMHVYSVTQNDVEGFQMTLGEFCQAACALSNKDMISYVQHMNNYFMSVPDIAYNDYASAIEGIYNGMDEKIDNHAAETILEWGKKAAEKKPQIEAEAPLTMVMGDAHKQLGDKVKAKEMYDKAFQIMMKSQQQQFIQTLQPQISKRIQALDE